MSFAHILTDSDRIEHSSVREMKWGHSVAGKSKGSQKVIRR